MSFIQKNVKGILLCLVLAIPCWFLGQAVPVVGGPVFGILAGMLITLLLKDKTQFQSGITFVSKKVLQYAVILLGFGLNLSVILETGKQSLPIILATISTSLIIAYVLHRIMHVPGKISTLVGVGSSICGGSAIAATAPVIDADDEEVAQAISVIFFFNMLAAVFPGPRRAARIFHHKRRSLRNFRRNCCQRYFFRDRCRIHLGFPLSARYTDTGQSCYRKADPYPLRSFRSRWYSLLSARKKPVPKAKKSSLKRFSRCLFSTLCWLPSSQQSQPLSVFPHPYFLLSKH